MSVFAFSFECIYRGQKSEEKTDVIINGVVKNQNIHLSLINDSKYLHSIPAVPTRPSRELQTDW